MDISIADPEDRARVFQSRMTKLLRDHKLENDFDTETDRKIFAATILNEFESYFQKRGDRAYKK